MFGAIAGGIASALAGGAMSKLFGGGQKAASGGIQGDVLATDNNTVCMGDAGIKSAIQGSNVPNPDEAVPSFVSGAMAKAGKGLLEGTLQAGTSAVSDKLLDLVGLGGKSAADRKSGLAGMPRPISYAVFCLKKKRRKKGAGNIKNPRNADKDGGSECRCAAMASQAAARRCRVIQPQYARIRLWYDDVSDIVCQ